MTGQTASGKAFEYTVAHQIAIISNLKPHPHRSFDAMHRAFRNQPQTEQQGCTKAAVEAVTFLVAHDERFRHANEIYLPPSQSGRLGDVRDLIVTTGAGEKIGISAKNRHKAVKHSRISASIDFGKEWMGIPCSNLYKQNITQIFQKLETLKGGYWRDIQDKHDRFYFPLLEAFVTEIKDLNYDDPNEASKNLLRYLLGRFDFYKVVKENGTVSIQSYNLNGTLRWGNKTRLTGEIVKAGLRKGSKTTVDIIFSNGWSLSFRLHNASSRIEPSLKFDIQIVGFPPTIRSHEIKFA